MRSGQIVYQFEGYLLIKDNKEYISMQKKIVLVSFKFQGTNLLYLLIEKST